MITAAEIKSIDFNNNTCSVDIPIFRTAANEDPVILTAYFCTQPGIYNGYQLGDKVWVSFIDNSIGPPAVLGKITIDPSSPGGAIRGKSLSIGDSAILPSNTSFINTDAEYNTLLKIINKLKEISGFLSIYENLEFTLKNLEAHTITTAQNIDDKPIFALGKILFVQNNTGSDYSVGDKITIYPFQNSTTNMLEYSDKKSSYSKLTGTWQVKATLTGAVFAQRSD